MRRKYFVVRCGSTARAEANVSCTWSGWCEGGRRQRYLFGLEECCSVVQSESGNSWVLISMTLVSVNYSQYCVYSILHINLTYGYPHLSASIVVLQVWPPAFVTARRYLIGCPGRLDNGTGVRREGRAAKGVVYR